MNGDVTALLDRLSASWLDDPDSRFGQLVVNVVRTFRDADGRSMSLFEISDEKFLMALDAWDEDHRRRREGARREGPDRPPDPALLEIVGRTTEAYSEWSLQSFGRMGRDPARIGPFLDYVGRVWLERADLRFGELVCSAMPEQTDHEQPDRSFPSALQLVEEAALLRLLDGGPISASEITDAYLNRGPLGDLLKRLESPNEDPKGRYD